MIIFLEETKEAIVKSGHCIEDIIFIGSEESGHSCTWDEFVTLANFEYDHGYGFQEVASDLIIVFKDKQKMWRHEYDGSEHWKYSPPFIIPSPNPNKIKRFIYGGNDVQTGLTLRELNEGN